MLKIKFNKKLDKVLIFCVISSIILHSIHFVFIFNDKYADWDGLFYLIRAFLFQNGYRIGSIYTPLTFFIIVPSVEIGRIQMKILVILTSILIYLIVKKKTKNRYAAVISFFSYSFNLWLLQFTAYTLMDLFSSFFFVLGLYLLLNKRKYFLSGISFGFSAIIKYHFILLFSSLFLILLFLKEYRKKLMPIFLAFLIIVGPFEFLLDKLFNKKTNYAPLYFLKENFSYYKSFIVKPKTKKISLGFNTFYHCSLKFLLKWGKWIFLVLPISFFFIKKFEKLNLIIISLFFGFLLQSLIITKLTCRVFIVPILSVIPFLASNVITFLNEFIKPKNKTLWKILLTIVFSYFFLYPFLYLFFNWHKFYKIWRPDLIDYPEKINICSNFVPAILFFGRHKHLGNIVHMFIWLDEVGHSCLSKECIINYTLSKLKNCKYIYFFNRKLSGGTIEVLDNFPDFIEFLKTKYNLLEVKDIGETFVPINESCFFNLCFSKDYEKRKYYLYIFQ